MLLQDIKWFWNKLKLKFYINFTESRRMKIDVWKEEIKLDLGKKKVGTNKTKQNNRVELQ